MKAELLEVHARGDDPQARGRGLGREQIDGAFSFDTDDYVLEAKWWKTSMSRESLDVFAAKVKRKGKNALGLYVSINGFNKDALEEYGDSTPFITLDGMDLMECLTNA